MHLRVDTKSAVVLVHGLAAHRVVMSPLERHLKPRFTQVTNWGYSSLWSRIERHGAALAKLLSELESAADIEQIHLVTHSMGGIIGRLALVEKMPTKLGRMVMVAPPNGGSHVARWLSPLLGLICPPLVQLSDHDQSFVAGLPPLTGVYVGVVAAAADELVCEQSTHLPNEADHITLPGFHSSILWFDETARQVAHFLEQGRFERGADTTRVKQPAAA
ncbi:MAG TPA: alpha/beta fold hydrolase [Pirellulaceae bacterium]|nr:alpha/beta fold hydrolase [Pirellulaceae bacterium]